MAKKVLSNVKIFVKSYVNISFYAISMLNMISALDLCCIERFLTNDLTKKIQKIVKNYVERVI